MKLHFWPYVLTFIKLNEKFEILGNFFSKGVISLTSGNLIPTKSGFLRNTSLCLAVKFPKRKEKVRMRIK